MFTTILFLVVLSILVFVHELGHFLLAKWAKVRVDEFAIGFPPTIFSYKPKNSETKYALNLIPFGGYVKIYGENPMDVAESVADAPDKDKSVSNQPAATPVNKGLSITKIPKYKQVMILLAGVAFNIIFAYMLFVIGMTMGMPTGYDASLSKYFSNRRIAITEVLPGSPAEKVGIKSGDEILSIKGLKNGDLASKEFTKEFFQEMVSQSSGPVSLSLKRGGNMIALSVTPGDDIVRDKKAIGVGIADIGTLRLPFYKAIYYGGISTVSMTTDICTRLASLIYDAVRGLGSSAHLSGPVGIAKMVGQASESGFVYLLLFTAIISINLAVLNTLPFPALDGGRVLFVIIEFFKRSPIRPAVVQWFNLAGFGILILLMILITIKDIVGLF